LANLLAEEVLVVIFSELAWNSGTGFEYRLLVRYRVYGGTGQLRSFLSCLSLYSFEVTRFIRKFRLELGKFYQQASLSSPNKRVSSPGRSGPCAPEGLGCTRPGDGGFCRGACALPRTGDSLPPYSLLRLAKFINRLF
jgi:hypothetical protein